MDSRAAGGFRATGFAPLCPHTEQIKPWGLSGSEAKLADETMTSQVREIAKMKLLIEDNQRSHERGERPLAPRAAVVTQDMPPEIRTGPASDAAC